MTNKVDTSDLNNLRYSIASETIGTTWSFDDFVRLHGDYESVVVADSKRGMLEYGIFEDANNNQTIVCVSNVIKKYSYEDFEKKKHNFEVVVLESGLYCVCEKWEDVNLNERPKNSWNLLEFAKAHGKMQVGDFVNKETGEEFKACIFTKPDDGTRTFVAFSTKLGELTPKQIVDMKNELQVVQLESGNYSLCKIDSGWKDVDLEEWLAAEAHEQRASQNDSAINAVPSQSELVRKAKGILSNGEEIGIDTIFTSKDFIKGRKLKVKSLTAKFSIADIEESYMEGSQWRSKLGYYNISQDTQYHVSDIRTIEYDREKDILKLNFIQIVNNKYDSIWFSRKFDRISIEFYRHHALMMEQKSRFDKACLPLEDLFYAFCSLSQFDGKDAIVTLSGGAYQADCFQNYYNDSQVRNFKELVDVRYVYEELDEIVRGTTTDEYYMKQHGMTREEYLKENFNEVNTLTARCLKNEIDAYVHEDYSELEVGKMYKVTHIGVFRSSTSIMLEDFDDKEYNSVCFELFENGESIDRKYTREHRFWAPYLRKLKKIE